jgi:hypothetical protein
MSLWRFTPRHLSRFYGNYIGICRYVNEWICGFCPITGAGVGQQIDWGQTDATLHSSKLTGKLRFRGTINLATGTTTQQIPLR